MTIAELQTMIDDYAKGKPVKPFSEVREQAWEEVVKDIVSRDGRRENDMSELENKVEK